MIHINTATTQELRAVCANPVKPPAEKQVAYNELVSRRAEQFAKPAHRIHWLQDGFPPLGCSPSGEKATP